MSEAELQKQMRIAKDDFDRTVMPQPSSPVEAVMPSLYRFELANGIKVLGTEFRETPTVELQLVVPAGRRFEPAGKDGLARLTASMMEEASQKSTAEALSSRLDTLGSTIGFTAGQYGT
ncbi:insulinase family protein, partial [Vibrio natriegens]